ncbi:hypothetical protein Sste5346_001946 [Sporothrix stenoceras]|uniref:UmuC domain-containing protein n=1 Tax=Sporothrix stenoceras TaxID=5173 RepID=A0ABR3ZLH5_9PEZI
MSSIQSPSAPRRNDGRIILHFDYDCFYAQVVQNRAPGGALIGRCVGVTQKSILATCNYKARRRGVKKLMRITEARRICPDIVLVDGEDLSPFRDVSKQLYRLMRDMVGPTAPVERLGLDEMFVDATALIDANLGRILAARSEKGRPRSDLFVMSDGNDGVQGFQFDSSSFTGHVIGNGTRDIQTHASSQDQHDATASEHTKTRMRLLMGSHLAAHLRLRLEHDAGYTSSSGISTSKLLSKLAGKVNKPANQTTLVSAGWSSDDVDADAEADSVVWQFMDPLPLRSVPGIGFKTSSLLSRYFYSAQDEARKEDVVEKADQEERRKGAPQKEDDEGEEEEGDEDDDYSDAPPVTVMDIRTLPGISPRLFDSILGGNNGIAGTAGAPAGNIPTGLRTWQLLHGVDDTPVKGGRDLPSQISIEDTYAGPRQGTLRPDAASAVAGELHKLATSLLRRMHVDLLDSPSTAKNANSGEAQPSWLARPRTLRLTLRPQMPRAIDNKEPSNYFARMSHSQPLPGFVLSLTMPPRQIVDRLVAGSLVPMFRKLAATVQMGRRASSESATSSTGGKAGPLWTVGLLNVCVANMAHVAGRGDDIAALFKRQDNGGVNRNETPKSSHDGLDDLNNKTEKECDKSTAASWDSGEDDDHEGDEDGWAAEEDESCGTLEACAQCGHLLPTFALAAHARFHLLGN